MPMRKNEELEKRRVAFSNVMNEYESRLLRYAARLTNNITLSQDIVQEAFIRLYENWKKEFVVSSAMSAWLYRTTHNIAVDYIRKESRRKSMHKKHFEEKNIKTQSHNNKSFMIDKVVQALNVLTPRERQLVILKVYEDKKYKEISEITGLSVSNIGFILHTAIKKMADYMKK